MSVHGSFNIYAPIQRRVPKQLNTERFAVVESNWGYTVRNLQGPDLAVTLMQALCWLLGMAFVVATLGLWIMPSSVFSTSALSMKLGISCVLAPLAYYSLWYASRGTQVEVQVDTRAAEVREIVRNRAGRPRQLNRYSFDDIGSVFVDLSGARNRTETTQGTLILRYKTTAQTIQIAFGTLGQLVPLRDKLGRDLMLGGKEPAPRPAAHFAPQGEADMQALMAEHVSVPA